MHTRDVEAAMPSLYLPATQSMQTEASEAPGLGLNFPRGHEMHDVTLRAAGVALYVPGEH